ncbi:MAG TPA: phosphomannomutase/phosphoglucomutase [Candidatus Saccharimonadales bacterium]|nr:phosphomannomutase/phosphoglucomutase [Candidatus Saccharimonadales bacterium]
MKVSSSIFRAYDLRGLVGTELSPELAEHLGKAFGTFLKRSGIHDAVVGRDSRATSPAYSEALIRGLSWAGIDVIDIGMQMVGMFYWSQYHFNRRGGVYVSASHNPPEFNGFKFANDFSETLVTAGMNELRRLVETEDYEQGATPGSVRQEDIRPAYFSDIIKRVPLTKKLKVVVDPSCTTAGEIAPTLLRQAGCEVIEHNTTVDPSFPLGVADPTEKTVMERVSREVVEAGADIGFTYDADGDRIGIVDEKGGLIWNDVLVALFASAVLREHKGATIMYNTFCSKAVPQTIIRDGGTPFMWRTGHSFLKKKNQEVKAAFIGELSGHFFFSADFYNHDDGLYSTMRLLRYLCETGQTLSEAVAALPQYVSSPEIKLACADDKKVALVEKLVPILKSDFPEAEIVDDERAGDGVRLETPDDRMFVIRYSQNGPYLGIKFEAKSPEAYDKLRSYLAELLHRFPEVDWQSKIAANTDALETDI